LEYFKGSVRLKRKNHSTKAAGELLFYSLFS
jgi:hypothetical protein